MVTLLATELAETWTGVQFPLSLRAESMYPHILLSFCLFSNNF